MSWVLRPPSAGFHVRCLLRLFGELLFASGLKVDATIASRSKTSAGTNPPSPPPQNLSPQTSPRFHPSPGMLSLLCLALRGEQRFVPSAPLVIGRLDPASASG